MDDTTRRCVTCNLDKPLSEFRTNEYTQGPRGRCKACWTEYRRLRYVNTDHGAKQRQRQKRTYDSYRKQVFDFYGRRCTCCGETIDKFLSIDHIDGGGNIHRREIKANGALALYKWIVLNGFPANLQTHCYNCNCGKARNNGICPHKELMKHPDQDHADEVHEIHHPVGHGLLDTRRDLHNRSPHAMNTPIVGSQTPPPMDPTQGPQYA